MKKCAPQKGGARNPDRQTARADDRKTMNANFNLLRTGCALQAHLETIFAAGRVLDRFFQPIVSGVAAPGGWHAPPTFGAPVQQFQSEPAPGAASYKKLPISRMDSPADSSKPS
jgi:hypothetical protein